MEPLYNINMQPQYILKDDYGAFYYSDKNMTRLHRSDGPAIEHANGSKEWYVDGKRHRTDGPAYEGYDGSKQWFVDGKYHRLDGPAYEYSDGTKVWWVDGKLHRTDGPAYEGYDGSKFWYVDGKELTEDEFIKRTKSNSTIEINGRRFTVEQLNNLIEQAK